MRKATLLISSALTVIVASIFAPGCGNALSDQCTQKIKCEGGNDADVQACIGRYDGDEEVASAYGCDDAYGKYVDCLTSTGHCRKANWETSCDAQSQALDACQRAAMGMPSQ